MYTTLGKKSISGYANPPMKLKIGDKAPTFTLPDQNGQQHKLSAYKGQWVLLYFYPKDDTPGCTKEACAIRDHFPSFEKLTAKVFGVSTDSVKSHGKFVEKYKLPFTLLADTEKELVQAYGVWGKKKFMGREFMGTRRMSFLIDPKGKIAKIYELVKPDSHAEEVLGDLAELTR
jgi:peroxiredoxin Q/BCP